MRKITRQHTLFFFLTLLATLALTVNYLQPVTAQDTITISVDATQELNEISPYVYGLNHGPWSEVSLQMQEPAQDLFFTFLRWPGGEWGDDFTVTEYQLDLYMRQSNIWEAVPSIHVRLKNSTPEEAAEVVRYMNVENDYGVQYWYIGNEPNLFEDYTNTEFNEDWRNFAEAMLAVDPDITLVGPEISQFPDVRDASDYHAPLNDVWLREFLEYNGDLVDIVSVHRYPFPQGQEATTIPQLRENVPRWQTLTEIVRETIVDVVGEEIPIAITEANSHWSHAALGQATPDSYYNAVWWSGVLTTLIHEEVDIITYFILYSTGPNGAYGVLDRYNPRPTYYTYQLFGELGEIRLQTESSDEYVTVIAANREDGATTVIITNLYEEERTISLDLTGLDDVSAQSARIMTPEISAEEVAVEDYLSENTLTMPAQSVILLVFE